MFPLINSSEKNTNRIVTIKKNSEMWNEVFREHGIESPACDGYLDWDLSKEEKRGSAWREVATCSKCQYKSKTYNLYDEVITNRPGRRAAKINLGRQVGIQHTPGGTTSYRQVCMASNIPPPSVSGMQHTSNIVAKSIESKNKEDLKHQREKVKRVKTLRGDNPHTINVQGDGVYSNRIYSGIGKTPFQPATQSTYTVAENETFKHNLIDTNPKSKLCSAKYKKHKVSTKVGEHAGFCSANLNMQDSIGDEQSRARECFEELRKDGLEVNEVTTDPDGSAYKAAECMFTEGRTSTKPVHYLDTRHISANHRKFVTNLSSVCDIMPARLKTQRKRLHGSFASDIAARCHAECTQAHYRYYNDIDRISGRLSHIANAIVDCYCGDHNKCRLYSFVCSKHKNMKSWIEKSAYLKRGNFAIDKNEKCKSILRQCVDYRLGKAMIAKTAKHTNTQKVEALNRAIRSTVPANVTYTRNYSSRVHTAVHKVNQGTGNSIVIMCDAVGSAIEPGSTVAKSLKKMDEHCQQRKKGKNLSTAIDQRNERKHALYDIHAQHQERKGYMKNQSLPASCKQQKESKKISECTPRRSVRHRKKCCVTCLD